MSSFDLTGKKIRNTYQRLTQISGSQLVDGTGSLVDNINVTSSFAITSSYAEYAVSASHEIIKEVSSSFADTASYVNPLEQDVQITGSLEVSGSTQVGDLTVIGEFKNYNEAIPDIGLKQDNDLRGYGNNYISNKTIAYSRISSAAFDEEGAIRIKDNIFQTYINGEWQDIVTNFRFREDSSGQYELEHKPIGFTGWIEVNSGNSDLLGLNGLPITQNYATSMGAFPIPLTLDGGTF